MAERQLPKLDVASSILVSRLLSTGSDLRLYDAVLRTVHYRKQCALVSLEPYPNG